MCPFAFAATTVHVLLACLPLALLGYVGRRLVTDSCNNVGLSPFGVAVACLALLLLAGALRWAGRQRLDALAGVAVVPALLAVGITYPLDRCNLIVYGQFTHRHLPEADQRCCGRLPHLPVCEAAEVAREEALASPDRILGRAAARTVEGFESDFVDLEQQTTRLLF